MNKQRKITAEHFAYLREKITPLDTRERRQQYRDGAFPRADVTQNVAKRYRWDLLYLATGTDHAPPMKWVCDNLYPYLDDTHIDTALRHILSLGHGNRITEMDVLFARADGVDA